jgi:hypothetical protein
MIRVANWHYGIMMIGVNQKIVPFCYVIYLMVVKEGSERRLEKFKGIKEGRLEVENIS